MHCFLHIGTEKTATTTIQNFLHKNRKTLGDLGYLYTTSAGIECNWRLAVSAYHPHHRDDFTKRCGISNTDELLLYQEKTIGEIRSELMESGIENVIFSSEHLQSRLVPQSDTERLRDVLTKIGIKKVTTIVYLRNPPELANSLFSTAVKCGSTTEMPSPPDEFYFGNICNHQRTIQKFETVFGEGSVIPRLFDPKEYINGSIIDDFLSILGITSDETFISAENKNKSISNLGLEILRRINHSIPTFIGDKPNHTRSDIVLFFEKHFSSPKYLMPPELYQRYESHYKKSNEWVRQKFFSEKECLFDRKPLNNSENLSYSKEELDKIADFLTDIWSKSHSNTP